VLGIGNGKYDARESPAGDKALTFHHQAHVQLLLAAHVHLELAGIHALRLTIGRDAIGVD